MDSCPLVTVPLQNRNQKKELCKSILKTMEPSQKAIYDNLSNEMILCPVDTQYPENTAGRVGSHEQCLRRVVQNEHPTAVTLEEEIEKMYRSTRLQKGPAGVSLWMEAFAPTCKIQADRIIKTIAVLEKKKWIEKDDHLHVNVYGHDCQEKFGGILEDVKANLHKYAIKVA